MINAVVLAAGFSKRMGNNKLLLKYRGKRIIEHVIEAIKSSEIDELLFIAREESIMEIARYYHCTVLKNIYANEGISSSIRIGCQYSIDAEGIIFVPGDQPLITPSTINSLIYTFQIFPSCIIAPYYSNGRGSPVIFPARFYDKLLKLQGDNGGKQIMKKCSNDVIYLLISEQMENIDIDRIEDLKKLP